MWQELANTQHGLNTKGRQTAALTKVRPYLDDKAKCS
jgi:hypothetical protein